MYASAAASATASGEGAAVAAAVDAIIQPTTLATAIFTRGMIPP
jgi:hypothetical protein